MTLQDQLNKRLEHTPFLAQVSLTSGGQVRVEFFVRRARMYRPTRGTSGDDAAERILRSAIGSGTLPATVLE